MRRALLLVLIAACQPSHPSTARPASDAVTVPRAPVGAVSDAGLDPPSEELGPPPASLALSLTKVVDGLDRPVLVTFAPGDPLARLFVLEQHAAKIRTLTGGTLDKKAFLDLGGKVSTDNEQGLLGLAFHPDFAHDHRLYVYITDPDGNSHVFEYATKAADSDAVDLSTRRELFYTEQPYANHNGGNLQFGPDGKLYLGLGDGGLANDPHGNGQNANVPLAKLLRFDVDAAKPKAEIVAMGLRNPWRWDFDPKTGDLYIGDVGQDTWEEVDVVASPDGKNFGWNTVEARHCFKDADCDLSQFTLPVVEYKHDVGCSVTGGVVYRGKAIPALDGVYFYGDYCIGWIRSFRWAADGIRDHWEWRPVLDPESQVTQISSFGRDADGEVYVVSLDGTIWKITPAQ